MRLGRVSVLILLLSSLSSAQKAKLDMLDWMTMDPFGSHMSGSGTPMWTVMDAAQGKFYWVKSAKGYPWDVKSYDTNFIYDTITEVSWSDPQTFKRHIGPNGKGYPIAPRFVPYVPGAAPTKLWTITIPPSNTNFEIHSSCSQYRISNLGYAKTEIWGPFYESLGGDLPPNAETLHLIWLWSCDSLTTTASQRAVHVTASLRQREMGKLQAVQRTVCFAAVISAECRYAGDYERGSPVLEIIRHAVISTIAELLECSAPERTADRERLSVVER
jgi:hypothetical protein